MSLTVWLIILQNILSKMENVHPTDKALKLIILSAALAAFMSSLDGTIVNIALPTISDIFDLPSSSVSWVSTIYLSIFL